MTRMIDVEVEEKRIKINFPYRRELVDLVRTLPDRWYDNKTKTWFVPLEHLDYVIRRLDDHHFKHSRRLRKYRRENGGGSESDGLDTAVPVVPDGTWTVSRLNQAARSALRQRFEQSLWVVGELQDYDKNRSSNYRNYFFDLVERPFAGANEIARIKAVLFERHRKTVQKRLRESDLELADGLSVRIRGKIDLYAKNGRYQILVDDIDPAYTAGEIELNRERVFRALQKKGLEKKNRQLAWSVCPLRVGLITSVDSDAYNDFVHQLRQSGFGFCLTAHHANVQGVHTERSVMAALTYFRKQASEFDVIAIVRGGGSRSELAYFDTEAIGAAICNHPVKVICGVGHQRDQCLLDLICESTKTPTAAANRIVEAVQSFRRCVDERSRGIAERARRRVAAKKKRLRRNAGLLERRVQQRLEGARRRQTRRQTRLEEGARRCLTKRRRRLKGGIDKLAAETRRQADRRRYRLEAVQRKLSFQRLRRMLVRERLVLSRRLQRLDELWQRSQGEARSHLAQIEEKLSLVDPRQVLKRGFALVRTADGIARSVEEIALGDDFDVMLADGVLRARRIEGGDEGPEADRSRRSEAGNSPGASPAEGPPQSEEH